LADKTFLVKRRPDLSILKHPIPIGVTGIGADKYICDEYAIIDIFINGTVGGEAATAKITRTVNIVTGLKAKVLIGVNMLAPEQCDISFKKNTITLHYYEGLVALIVTVARKGKT